MIHRGATEHASEVSRYGRSSDRVGGHALRCWSLGVAVVLSLWAAPAALGADSGGSRAARASSAAQRVKGMLLPVWADFDGSTPISGGHVRVYAGGPRKHAKTALVPMNRRRAVTNAHGVATLEFAHLPRQFIVMVSGGRVLGHALKGSMSTQVHGYRGGSAVGGVAAGRVVLLNPITTLVDALEQVNPGLSQARARMLVDRALGIPKWVDGIDLSVDDRWMDGRIFLRDIRAHLTLDGATGALVLKIRHGKHVTTFRGPATGHRGSTAQTAAGDEWWKDIDISELVKGGLSSLGQGIFQAVGGGGASWAFSQFLNAVGLGKLADALFPLYHIVDQLNEIAAQVTAVKSLVETGIQATEHSQYNQLVSRVSNIDGDVSALWERMRYESSMSKDDPTLKNYNADLIATIGRQLVENHTAIQDLNSVVAPSAPASYGILQAASAYLGSQKFYTQASAKTMQAVFDYYQLMQLRLSVLLTNYYSTRPDTFSPTTIRDTVINKITENIAGQQALMKPTLPAGTFIDLRPDTDSSMLLWGPVSWVDGGSLEHYCVDQRGVRHRYYVNVQNLTCDPPGHDSANAADQFATEAQLKALLDGWTGKTPLAWLQGATGLKMTAAPDDADKAKVGFYWVGRSGSPANRAGPVEGPFCKIIVCLDDNSLGYYEYLHRYDMQDTSTPSPDAWVTSLWDYDPWNYSANGVVVNPVKKGEYFWPVGGG